VFDGVHLGHQQIIRQMVDDAHRLGARPLVVTFDRHPNAVVAPDRVPPRIFARSQKLRAIAALGVETLLEIPFNAAFSQISGEAFIRSLARTEGFLGSICVGAAFVFGHQRGGNVELLRRLGAELQFQVHGLAAVSLDGQVVSSTRIREAIAAGDLDAASQMLGRPVTLCGPVVTGDQLGRTIGFPTANLDLNGQILPPNGVYAAETGIGPARYLAAVNLGTRPTVSGSGKTRVEAHLLDFKGDLYGQEVELTLRRRLRGEERFGSLAALQSQIARDIAQIRTG
jgi:riboflavin kinase/FMN adenylyltransferase